MLTDDNEKNQLKYISFTNKIQFRNFLWKGRAEAYIPSDHVEKRE